MYFIIVAWTCSEEHYTAIFATWTNKNDDVETILICCGVQEENDGEEDVNFSAESIGDYFYDELELIGLNLLEDVDFIVGDNCPVNKCIADKMTQAILAANGRHNAFTVPLVGCASHRLNLSRSNYYDGHKVTVEQVDLLMSKLKTLKNSSKLRKKTKYRPTKRNVTRWSSTHKMLKKCLKIHPVLATCNFDNSVLSLVPNHIMLSEITSMVKDDNDFESVSKSLQFEGEKLVDMYATRKLFDGLISKYPECSDYLAPNSDIVHSPIFESAVCKVQGKLENTLDRDEKISLKRFLNNPLPNNSSTRDENDDDTELSFAEKITNNITAEKRQRTDVSKYRSLKHVAKDSNMVERLFSRAKLIMRDHRKHMSPYHLEMLLFLRCNSAMWNVQTVDDIIKENKVIEAPQQPTTEANDSDSD